jgi:hypothetical protein
VARTRDCCAKKSKAVRAGRCTHECPTRASPHPMPGQPQAWRKSALPALVTALMTKVCSSSSPWSRIEMYSPVLEDVVREPKAGFIIVVIGGIVIKRPTALWVMHEIAQLPSARRPRIASPWMMTVISPKPPCRDGHRHRVAHECHNPDGHCLQGNSLLRAHDKMDVIERHVSLQSDVCR